MPPVKILFYSWRMPWISAIKCATKNEEHETKRTHWLYSVPKGWVIKVNDQSTGCQVTTKNLRYTFFQDFLTKHIIGITKLRKDVVHSIGHVLILYLVQEAIEPKAKLCDILPVGASVSEDDAINTITSAIQSQHLDQLHEIIHNVLQKDLDSKSVKIAERRLLVKRMMFVLRNLADKIAEKNACHLVLDQQGYLIHQPDSEIESLLTTIFKGPDIRPSRSRSNSLVVDDDDNEGTPQKETADTDGSLLHNSPTDWSPPASQSDCYGQNVLDHPDFESFVRTMSEEPDVGSSRSRSHSFLWDGDDNEDTPQKESAGTDHYLVLP